MFFRSNKNELQKESTKELVKVGELDLSKRYLESPDFDEFFEFDSLVDGWNSIKIGLSGNYTINGSDLILGEGAVTFTINNSLNPLTYLKIVTNDYSPIAGLNLVNDVAYEYSNPDSSGVLIACSVQFSITKSGLVIKRIFTLDDLCGFNDSWRNYGGFPLNYFLKTGIEDRAFSDSSPKIIRLDKKNIYSDFYEKRHIRGLLTNNSVFRFFSRYTKQINVNEDTVKDLSQVDLVVVSDSVVHPFLDELNLHGHGCTFKKRNLSTSQTVVNLYSKIDQTIRNSILNLQSDKESGISIGVVSGNFWEELILSNLSYRTEGLLPSFDSVSIQELLHDELVKIEIYGRTGDFDFSLIQGHDFSKLVQFTIAANSMSGTDFDFSNQHLPALNFMLSGGEGVNPPTTTKSGTLTLKNIPDYEFWDIRLYGYNPSDGGTYGGWDYILPDTALMVDNPDGVSVSNFVVNGLITSAGVMSGVVTPKITVAALRSYIYIYELTVGSKINNIVLQDITYEQIIIILGGNRLNIDFLNFEIENIQYALNILSPTVNNSYIHIYYLPLNLGLRKIVYYFKKIIGFFELKVDSIFEEDLLLDSGYCEYINFRSYRPYGHFKTFQFPKLTNLQNFIINTYNALGSWDISKINTRAGNSDTFISGSQFTLAYGLGNTPWLVKLPETVESQYENNHTASSLYSGGVVVNFNDFKLGDIFIFNTLTLHFATYQCIEFISQIYANSLNFKPRPLDVNQDTSNYAKVIQRSILTAENWQSMAIFLNSNQMPKPLGYVQANSTTNGNDGTIVYPKNQTINNGFIEFVDGNKINSNFSIPEYDTPVKLSFNIEFTGDLIGENPENYIILIKDKITTFNPTNAPNSGQVFYLNETVLSQGVIPSFPNNGVNENYILAALNEDGFTKFNFLPKEDLCFYILKYRYPGLKAAQPTIKLIDAIYCDSVNLTEDTIINLTLDKVRRLSFDISVTYDGEAITGVHEYVEFIINGCPIRVGRAAFPLANIPYKNGANFIQFSVFLSGVPVGEQFFGYAEVPIDLSNETSYNYLFEIQSYQTSNLTNTLYTNSIPLMSFYKYKGIPITSTPIRTFKYSVIYFSMEMDYINGYLVPYKKVLGFNADYNLSFEYPTRYPSGGVAGDRLMSFMEGSIKALGNNDYNVYSAYNVYMIENTVNGEEETLLWTGSNANNLPSKNFTKFRVEFSFVFKVLCMYYQYAYVLANQKKDLTETLKYRWSITS